MRPKVEDRIGERFLSKRPPPSRHGWLFVGTLVGALIATIILFAYGQWQPGVLGLGALVAVLAWARRSMLP